MSESSLTIEAILSATGHVMIGISVLYSTINAKVVRKFLLACDIADVGHLYAIYAVIHQFSEFVIVVLRELFMR